MFFILHIVALLCLIRVLIKPLERSTVVVQVHQNKQEHKICVFLFYFLILCYLLSDKVLWNKVKGAHTVYTSIFIMTSGQNPFKATLTATDHWIRLHHVQAPSRLPEIRWLMLAFKPVWKCPWAPWHELLSHRYVSPLCYLRAIGQVLAPPIVNFWCRYPYLKGTVHPKIKNIYFSSYL